MCIQKRLWQWGKKCLRPPKSCYVCESLIEENTTILNGPQYGATAGMDTQKGGAVALLQMEVVMERLQGPEWKWATPERWQDHPFMLTNVGADCTVKDLPCDLVWGWHEGLRHTWILYFHVCRGDWICGEKPEKNASRHKISLKQISF
jgi:hypothetical protein